MCRKRAWGRNCLELPGDSLRMLGLPLDAKLSVIVVELLPEPGSPFQDPLERDLGQVRILRTSPLTAVPEICPPIVA